ncbi:hypothetical protein O7599_13315 [Streptomyces sp. WMMC500]|uniref:hypothetical protein n=1 Tax=Streptomyces sp. WMMC500 TaxID=3015154 RepID=UPI00248D06BA|nr:hypothetical protein [Streptomyces sp. WMMC500]WBB63437.1 hypothetical protein O7599_13315 [Streptomyces sp. WMMC500]
MGTSGEPRPVALRARGVAAALGAAVLLAGTPACSSGGGDGDGPSRTRTAAPSTAAPPTGEPVRDRACEVALPDGWSDALADGRVPAPRGERTVLTEVGPGAGWAVLQSTAAASASASGDGRSVVLREGDEQRSVMRLADPVEHQLGSADFDGRWLVFDVVEGRRLESLWTLYAWDATTGRREAVAEAAAEAAEGGQSAVPGPFVQAVVRSGRLFWAQGTGGGRSAVYARDLGPGGERRTVYEGVVDTPFAAGGLLVWLRQGESSSGRPETRLAAVSMDTMRRAELPGPIAGLRNVRYVASDGRTWAWAGGDADRPRLYVWREGWPKPLALVRGEGGGAVPEPELGGIDQVGVSGEVVTWRTTEAAWALDLRSRSYTRITPRYGYALARDGGLGVAYPEGEAKAAEAKDVVQLTRTSTLPPLPGCG